MNTTSHPPKKTAIENQGAEGCRAAANWSALPSDTPPTWETVARNLGTALERCENMKSECQINGYARLMSGLDVALSDYRWMCSHAADQGAAE